MGHQQDLLRFLTAGSVDDGKSTLIGRLLHDSKSLYDDHLAALTCESTKRGYAQGSLDYSLITDGLKAEREQGITIDVAYRYFSTLKRKFIIADTPGHEQYTRNMATGASTADLLLLLVSAEHGILPQTRRHSFIASLMGIKHFVVAVNKMDLVDYSEEVYEQIKSDYMTFAKGLNVPDIHFIPLSAFHGDNIVDKSATMTWFGGSPLLSYLEDISIERDTNLRDLRFPVQLVLRGQSGGRSYAGTVASGIMCKGDEVVCLPSWQRCCIDTIYQDNREVEEARPHQAITVALDREIDLSRGNMLAMPTNHPQILSKVDAMIIWMDSNCSCLPGQSYLLKHTTQTVVAEVEEMIHKVDIHSLDENFFDVQKFSLNEIGCISLQLRSPIFADNYEMNRETGSFLLIDRLSNHTVAAGMIVGPVNRKISATIESTHIQHQHGKISRHEREQKLGQKGCVIWLTGLPGSGKSTLAYELEKQLLESGRAAYVLDGDNMRYRLNRDLGFSPEDRKENIRRVSEVAALFADAGIIVITALISPYREERSLARDAVHEGRFFEIYLNTPLACCEERDPKGHYRKARAGEIKHFTGVSAPYEAPLHPDLILDTSTQSIDTCVHALTHLLTTSFCSP